MKFDPDKLLGLKTLTQGTVMIHMSAVNTYPPFQAAWLRLWSAIAGGTFNGLLAGVPLAIGSTVLLRRYGRGLTKRRRKRGSQLVPLPQLLAEVAVYNEEVGRPDREADARRILAGVPWHRRATVSRRALVEAGMYEPFCLAGIPYPWRAEQAHTMLVGATGTGKSTVMKNLLDQIRARGGRAVVFDLTGTYVESFYNAPIWLLRGLRPDFRTIADFRCDNRVAFKAVFRAFVLLCRRLDLFGRELVAVDGTRLKAVNSRRRNFTRQKLAD